MSYSIDGKIHGTNLILRYGDEFPKRYTSREFYIPNYGNCLVYIIHVGTPEWIENMKVSVPLNYYLTQVYDDEHKVTKNKTGLYLIK